MEHRLAERRVAADQPAETSPLSVDVLGARVDDEIGTELSGCCSNGVANTLSTITFAPARCAIWLTAARSTSSSVGLPGDPGKRDRPRAANARSQARQILAVDQLDLDAEAWAQLGEDPMAGTEQQGRADDPHARAQLAHQGRMHCRHAAGGGGAVLRALEQRHPLLQHPDRGVAHPRVGVALLGLGEAGLGVLGALVTEAGGQKERLGGLAVGRAVDSAMDEAGLRAPGRRHRGRSPHDNAPASKDQGVVTSRPFSGTPGRPGIPSRGPASRPAQIHHVERNL